MRSTDKPRAARSPFLLLWSASGNLTWLCLSMFFVCAFAACDRIGNSRYVQLMQNAENKSTQGDFERARTVTNGVREVARKRSQETRIKESRPNLCCAVGRHALLDFAKVL